MKQFKTSAFGKCFFKVLFGNPPFQSLCGEHCPRHKKNPEQSSYAERHNATKENEISKTMDTQNIDRKYKPSLNDCLKVYLQELLSTDSAKPKQTNNNKNKICRSARRIHLVNVS